MTHLKLSSKNQIVLPKEARDAMQVKGGDELLVVVKGKTTVLMPKPKSYAQTLGGTGKGLLPEKIPKKGTPFVVSLARLEAFLNKHKRVGLDSNVLIYFIEANPEYHVATQKRFEFIETDHNRGICSTLSLLEVLVQPYRTEDDELTNQFYSFLTTYPNLSWIAVPVEIADLGAKLRAQYELKTPDAILMATAIHSGASGFIGNDAQLTRVTDMDVLLLTWSRLG